MQISSSSCSDTIEMRDRIARGWTYHAGPPMKHFCGKPNCQAAYRAFIEQTKLGPSR